MLCGKRSGKLLDLSLPGVDLRFKVLKGGGGRLEVGLESRDLIFVCLFLLNELGNDLLQLCLKLRCGGLLGPQLVFKPCGLVMSVLQRH